jgi:hypothetical protein
MFSDLPPEDRRILYASTALDRSIAEALKEMDPQACFVALVVSASSLLADVPADEREAFLRAALDAAGDWN